LKTLSLLAPDFAALDSIWRHPLPFVLWPVGHQGLIDHWIDESVRQGAVEIRIYAADRPAEIRRHLSAGGFWSQRAKVTAIRTEVDAPSEAIPMDRLPQQDRQEIRIPDSQTLLSDWLEMQRFWLTHRDPRSVSVDAEVMPDGWLGPHVRVHPRASLHPPFWIGAGTEIGAGCRVGPYAVVGEGSVLDHDVEIENAVALPGTYLGPNTRLNKAIAQGGILVDIRRACRIDINEDFILGTVARHQRQTSAMGKLAALGLWVLLAPFATLWPGQMWTSKRIINHQGLNLMLEGGSRGPLLLRRWPWLRQVALGNFCWFGILPRGDDEWTYLSAETAERLRSSPPGIFSWADLQGCHNPSSPDEWVHAAYQVLQPDETVKHLLQRQIVHLALLRPEV
jgi:carbonic anhydrase/acetyltransferase-like protein (isoleucine patch superfamily)